jgi:hypothetical protein
LHALDQLYYTKPAIDQKDGYTIGVGNPQEYADFLKSMIGLFGSEKSGSSVSSIDKILVRNPNCPQEAIKHYLQIQDPKAVASILQFVSQLFQRQLNHTKRVIQFFQTRLFKLKPNKEIDIHPVLLQGGLDELAKVSKEVRDILVDYYKDCETIYQAGAKKVLEAKSVRV